MKHCQNIAQTFSTSCLTQRPLCAESVVNIRSSASLVLTKMSDKTSDCSSRISLFLSAVVAVLCFGSLIRVELILREHRTLIGQIHEKTDCLQSCLKNTENQGRGEQRLFAC